ncbi:MAG: DNA topology modulation protein, partial [Anaerolineae bacterium]
MEQEIPKRFALIGLPGSGKSTFGAKLGKVLNIPVHHLDRHMFVAGGKKREKQEFLSIQKAMIDEELWIIEGCSLSTLEMRFARAGTVIYFHFPRLLCVWRVFKRLFIHDKTLCDTADGCSKIVSWEILQYIWNFDRKKRG